MGKRNYWRKRSAGFRRYPERTTTCNITTLAASTKLITWWTQVIPCVRSRRLNWLKNRHLPTTIPTVSPLACEWWETFTLRAEKTGRHWITTNNHWYTHRRSSLSRIYLIYTGTYPCSNKTWNNMKQPTKMPRKESSVPRLQPTNMPVCCANAHFYTRSTGRRNSKAIIRNV